MQSSGKQHAHDRNNDRINARCATTTTITILPSQSYANVSVFNARPCLFKHRYRVRYWNAVPTYSIEKQEKTKPHQTAWRHRFHLELEKPFHRMNVHVRQATFGGYPSNELSNEKFIRKIHDCLFASSLISRLCFQVFANKMKQKLQLKICLHRWPIIGQNINIFRPF